MFNPAPLLTATACPVFSLGQMDNWQLAAAGSLITVLVTGKVIAPTEPWIRGYLGLPAAKVIETE